MAEEFGFVGCIAILLLYAAVIFMGLRIASVAHSHFGRLDGVRNAVLITISEGVGAAALVNGGLMEGAAGLAGEKDFPLAAEGLECCVAIDGRFAAVLKRGGGVNVSSAIGSDDSSCGSSFSIVSQPVSVTPIVRCFSSTM